MPIDAPPVVETVVVRPARLPPSPGDAAFSIVQVAPEALRTQPRLDQVLTETAGVSLFRRTSSLGANPTTQGVSLRGIAGSGASRALVTLDGVPQNDPFGGWVIWTALPSEAIEGVQVVRGAGAGPYGAGALTGVVALDETTRVPGGIAGEAAGGDRGYARGAAALSADAGPNGHLFGFISGERSDGWTPVRQGRGAADVPLTLSDWSMAGRAQVDVGEAAIAARVSGYEERRGAGILYAGSRARGQTGSLTAAKAPTEESLGWRVQGWISRSDLQNSSSSGAAGRATATPSNNQYATPATGEGFNAAVRRMTGALTLEAGADVRYAHGESRETYSYSVPRAAFLNVRRSGGSTTTAGVYLEGAVTTAPWLVTGGVRLDRWSDTDAHRTQRVIGTGAAAGADAFAPDQSGYLPTGRLGVRRELSDGLYLRSAAYAGFRPATLNELHRRFQVGNDLTEANPGLKPERLYGAEAGLGGDRGPTHWSATAFYNRLQDAITNATLALGGATASPPITLVGYSGVTSSAAAGGALRQRRNIGRVDAAGVEAEARQELGPRLELQVSATYTYARVNDEGQAPQLPGLRSLTGLRPAETPRLAASAGATWKPIDPLGLRVDLRYEGARFDDDQNTRRLSPGLTVDARADWRVSGPISLFVAVENLFDAAIETGQTADGIESFGPPRLFRAGLTIRR